MVTFHRKALTPRRQHGADTDPAQQQPAPRSLGRHRQQYSLKSALDFPNLPLYRSIGPGTPSYNSTFTIPPPEDAEAPLTARQHTQHHCLLESYCDLHSRTPRGLRAPQCTTVHLPSPPKTCRPTSVHALLQQPRNTLDNGFGALLLPTLFSPRRPPPPQRHLVAVRTDGAGGALVKFRSGPWSPTTAAGTAAADGARRHPHLHLGSSDAARQSLTRFSSGRTTPGTAADTGDEDEP